MLQVLTKDSRDVLYAALLPRPLDQPFYFFLGEARQQARLACDRNRRIDLDFLVADALLDLIRVLLPSCDRRRS